MSRRRRGSRGISPTESRRPDAIVATAFRRRVTPHAARTSRCERGKCASGRHRWPSCYVLRTQCLCECADFAGQKSGGLNSTRPGTEQLHVLPTPSVRLGQLQVQWSAFVLVRVTRHSTYSKQTIKKPQESNTSGTRTEPRPRAASRARAPPAPATRRLGARRPRRRGPRP